MNEPIYNDAGEQIAIYNSQLGGYRAVNPDATSNTPIQPLNTITADSLLRNRTLNIPNQTTSTIADGISGQIQSLTEQARNASAIERETETARLAAQTKLNDSEKKTKSLMQRILGIQEQRPQVEEEFKIAEKSIASDSATKALEASQRAQTNELRRLQTSGLSQAQIADQTASINRRYAFEQADLALIQTASNRDLLTAQTLADRKISLALEPLKTQLDFEKEFYNANKDILTKAEERAFNARIKQDERAYEEAKTNETAKANIMLEAVRNGVSLPYSVVQELNRATNQPEMLSVLARNGISLQNPLEQQLKQAQIAKNYADAKAAFTTLPAPIQTRVQGIAGQFDAEPNVKTFNTIAQQKAFIESIPTNTTNPSDDQALVYAFAKIMDPDSVVREGEYATVQKYSQSWTKAYGKGITQAINGTGFLSEEARGNIKKTVDSRYKISEKAYLNTYNEYGRRINKVTGKADGTDYITDYRAAFIPTNTPTNTNQTIKSNGKDWIVGQVYNDGTANWVVDVNGKWTKQ